MKIVKAICVLACCAGVSLVAAGCSTSHTGSAGAVSAKKADCCSDKSAADCAKECADKKATTKAGSMGAVSEKKSGCCSGAKTN